MISEFGNEWRKYRSKICETLGKKDRPEDKDDMLYHAIKLKKLNEAFNLLSNFATEIHFDYKMDALIALRENNSETAQKIINCIISDCCLELSKLSNGKLIELFGNKWREFSEAIHAKIQPSFTPLYQGTLSVARSLSAAPPENAPRFKL